MVALPHHIVPMLALAGPLPAAAEDRSYAYETKWDGFRALTYWDGSAFAVLSRNQLSLLDRFPALAELRKALPKGTIVDGEIVALDAHGHESFHALQARSRNAKPTRIIYHIFDILHVKDRSTIPLTYLERRAILEALALHDDHWNVPGFHIGSGAAHLKKSRSDGREGVVAKRTSSIYRPGIRNDDWVKIKNIRRDEFIVYGYVPGKKVAGAGKLLLGYFMHPKGKKSALRFAGGVGTGLSLKDRLELQRFIDQHPSRQNPFAERMERTAAFTDRPFVVEVTYTEWTPAGALRHPSFMGIRPDKDVHQVTDPRVRGSES